MPRRGQVTEFSRVLGSIYDAGMDRSRWPEALGAISRACGGMASQMLIRDATEESIFGCVAGLPPEAHSEYLEHYAEQDVRFAWLRLLPKSQVYRESDLISGEEIASSPIYNELLPRYDLGTVMVADLPVRDLTAFFSVLAYKSRKRFEPRHVDHLRMLLPHLARAVEIQERLHGVEHDLQSSLDALELLAIGIVLIDTRSRVLFANRKALRMASGAGVRIGKSNVEAPEGQARGRLQSLIQHALRTSRGNGQSAGGVVRVTSPVGTTVLQVIPLPRSRRVGREGAWRGVEAMVILGGTDAFDPPPTKQLRQMYGLTPAEADLAARLLRGQSVVEIADERQVSVHTVRVQLKAVLSKAEVGRQAEFVARTWRALAGFGVS